MIWFLFGIGGLNISNFQYKTTIVSVSFWEPDWVLNFSKCVVIQPYVVIKSCRWMNLRQVRMHVSKIRGRQNQHGHMHIIHFHKKLLRFPDSSEKLLLNIHFILPSSGRSCLCSCIKPTPSLAQQQKISSAWESKRAKVQKENIKKSPKVTSLEMW